MHTMAPSNKLILRRKMKRSIPLIEDWTVLRLAFGCLDSFFFRSLKHCSIKFSSTGHRVHNSQPTYLWVFTQTAKIWRISFLANVINGNALESTNENCLKRRTRSVCVCGNNIWPRLSGIQSSKECLIVETRRGEAATNALRNGLQM